MFLLNILEAVLAYDLVKIRFIKEREAILNGNTNDKNRGIQLTGPGYLQKIIKGGSKLTAFSYYRTHPYKRIVKQFHSLQIRARKLLSVFL